MSFVTKKTTLTQTKSYNGWQQQQNGNNNDINSYDADEMGKYEKQTGLREKLQINEFKFSILLFIFSLSIVIGKLVVNYGEALQWQIDGNYIKKLPSLSAFPVINVTNLSNGLRPRLKFNSDRIIAAGENLINVTQRYEEAVHENVVEFLKKHWKWIRAVLSGISMMGFTWYIIYKDSSVPGVNPPSPLSLLRKRGHRRIGMQINYFVGVLNGILIFVYLTL